MSKQENIATRETLIANVAVEFSGLLTRISDDKGNGIVRLPEYKKWMEIGALERDVTYICNDCKDCECNGCYFETVTDWIDIEKQEAQRRFASNK